MQRDYFLDAEQALEMGLVDKVLTSREEQDQAMGVLGDKKDDKGNGGDGEEPAGTDAGGSQDPLHTGP
jgi:Clp protease